MNRQETEKLIRQVIEGDTAAFAKIVNAFRPALLEKMRRKFNSKNDVEDSCQEAFIKLYKAIGSIKSNNIPGWLFTVANNEFLNQLRKRGNEEKKQKESTLYYEKHEDEDQKIEKEAKLDQALQRLNSKCQHLLKLSFSSPKRSSKEIAEILGYASDSVVNTLKMRCLKELRAIFFTL